jgi:3-hydroxyisobutyrate dehydrogenase-like beta-hydroxyacid dehydrogenase
MGYPMAGHLAKAGHDVVVYNRTESRARDWCAAFPGSAAPTPALAALGRELVFSCVGNDDDVRAVMLGEQGILNAVAPNTIVVDHTTSSADIARELYRYAADRDVGFLDGPVSGGQAGAENGKLTIMLGGDEPIVARATPVMHCFAKSMTHIGPAGSGQLAKMVNQICIAGVLQGLSEGLAFAQRAGLDPALVINAVSGGAAQSWQMDNRWQTMVEHKFDFGFAVDWMRKDLGLALAEADKNGAVLDMTRLVDGYYAEVQALGGARWDTSSLIARLLAR